MPGSAFDIFLSSTSEDLREFRSKVREMIDMMRQITIGMETWGARLSKPFETCREEVQKCDALIVIVGQRYGWTPKKKDGGDGVKSITWWEVKWALDLRKPVYAFILDPAASWLGESEQDRLLKATTKEMFIEIGNSVRHLQTFRSFLDSNTTRQVFSSPDDLAAKVAGSLHEWILTNAIEALASDYKKEARQTIPEFTASDTEDNFLTEFDHLYWQEQIHLLSAKRISGAGDKLRIALIAGKANVEHPALAEASIKQLNLLGGKTKKDNLYDDYTTSLAALLVGQAGKGSYPGIVPKAQLTIFQVLSKESYTTVQAILHALDAAIIEGSQLICITLGSREYSAKDAGSFKRAKDKGVIVVCPAGNDGNDIKIYPAAYPDCLSVTALGNDQRLTSFANYGDWVTIAAPGKDIPSAVGNEKYQASSGASFSCVILTGVVALMLQANPNLKLNSLKKILQTTGPPAINGDGSGNAGKLKALDAYLAVKAASQKTRITNKKKGDKDTKLINRKKSIHQKK